MAANNEVVTTVHKTSTTTTTTGSGLSFRKEYLTSVQGIMCFLAMVYSLVAFLVILIGNTNRSSLGGSYAFFITISLMSFCYSLFNYTASLTNMRSKIRLPWNLTDLGMYFIMFLLMMISSSLVLSDGVRKASGSAATLGFMVVQFYFILWLLALRDYRYSRTMSQQGEGATDAAPAGSLPPNFDPAFAEPSY